MVKRSTRKNVTRKSQKGMRLVSRVYAPVSQALQLASNSVGIVTNTARDIVQRSIKAVNNIGTVATSRTDKAISGVVGRRDTRKNRNSRKNRGTRR